MTWRANNISPLERERRLCAAILSSYYPFDISGDFRPNLINLHEPQAIISGKKSISGAIPP
jgi:hypothetical protein